MHLRMNCMVQGRNAVWVLGKRVAFAVSRTQDLSLSLRKLRKERINHFATKAAFFRGCQHVGTN